MKLVDLRSRISESVKKNAAGTWWRAGAPRAALFDRKHCWQCFLTIFLCKYLQWVTLTLYQAPVDATGDGGMTPRLTPRLSLRPNWPFKNRSPGGVTVLARRGAGCQPPARERVLTTSEHQFSRFSTKILQENTASSVSERLARPQALLLAARCPLQKTIIFFTLSLIPCLSFKTRLMYIEKNRTRLRELLGMGRRS